MDKIVILASPVAPMQQIFVYQNGEITERIGVSVQDLAEIIYSIIETTGINKVEISGNHNYTLGIQEELTHAMQTEFTSIGDVNIVCI